MPVIAQSQSQSQSQSKSQRIAHILHGPEPRRGLPAAGALPGPPQGNTPPLLAAKAGISAQ